ncbi:MAG: Hint domain-containing protein, partial [Atribacterota bacterium]
PYVGLTRTVVTPEYTLPGGRSLSPYSISTYKILNGLYTKKLELSIRDAFVMHEEVEEMRILSQDESGEVVFAKVDKIFTSGQKRIYRLKTKKGFEIDASKDHLFFINDDYIPLSEIKIGDNCVCYDGKKIVEDKIFKIIKTEEFIEMYDMDVPSTRNLFMNGIKCHNSRWFRYLFSSGT